MHFSPPISLAVYSSINETLDPSQLVEDGYYAAPKSMDKVRMCIMQFDLIKHLVYITG